MLATHKQTWDLFRQTDVNTCMQIEIDILTRTCNSYQKHARWEQLTHSLLKVCFGSLFIHCYLLVFLKAGQFQDTHQILRLANKHLQSKSSKNWNSGNLLQSVINGIFTLSTTFWQCLFRTHKKHGLKNSVVSTELILHMGFFVGQLVPHWSTPKRPKKGCPLTPKRCRLQQNLPYSAATGPGHPRDMPGQPLCHDTVLMSKLVPCM